MPKKNPPNKVQNEHQATVAGIIEGYEQELQHIAAFREQYAELAQRFVETKRPQPIPEKLWKEVVRNTEYMTESFDGDERYLMAQLACLYRVLPALESEDIEVVRLAVMDYLTTDVAASFKLYALKRFDYQTNLDYGRKTLEDARRIGGL